ncbi:MAG: hypothetical protein N3B16_00495 [Candidatus Aminicenantes bacterium]|nr:hypothetical protein [Candidatus Aminicenantes bacterium]
MVTVIRVDGTTVQLPITPEDSNKTVWQFLQEKLPLDADRSQMMVKTDPTSYEDVADQNITKFEGKKLMVSPRVAK